MFSMKICCLLRLPLPQKLQFQGEMGGGGRRESAIISSLSCIDLHLGQVVCPLKAAMPIKFLILGWGILGFFWGSKDSLRLVLGAKKSTQRPRRKSWTPAPKSAFPCGPGGGEKLLDPWASGRKGQECLREIRINKFVFMLFFLP